MSQLGQGRRFEVPARYFRSTPINGHRETGPASPVGADAVEKVENGVAPNLANVSSWLSLRSSIHLSGEDR